MLSAQKEIIFTRRKTEPAIHQVAEWTLLTVEWSGPLTYPMTTTAR